MQVQLGMLGQKLCYPLGLMRREVVGDNMDLPAFGFQRNDLAEKGHKLLGGMVGGGLTQDFAAFGVQRSIERERAMPIVLEAVAFGSPRAKRQHRVEAVERLDGGLLIDAKYCGALRRIDVQPDHVGGLTLEVRISGGQVALQPMGLKPGALPNS